MVPWLFAKEFDPSDTYKVFAARKELPRDSACAAAKDTYRQAQ